LDPPGRITCLWDTYFEVSSIGKFVSSLSPAEITEARVFVALPKGSLGHPAGCGPLEKQPPGLKSLRENSKNRHQVGEIRERAREAGAKAQNISIVCGTTKVVP